MPRGRPGVTNFEDDAGSFTPEQKLAVSVLRLALSDARVGRPGARAFLDGGPLLTFWCALADDLSSCTVTGFSDFGCHTER